jgi:hypothetical protein
VSHPPGPGHQQHRQPRPGPEPDLLAYKATMLDPQRLDRAGIEVVVDAEPVHGSPFVQQQSPGEQGRNGDGHRRMALFVANSVRKPPAAAFKRLPKLGIDIGRLEPAGWRWFRRACRGHRKQMDHLISDLRDVGAEPENHPGHDAVILIGKCEEEVLGTDVVMAERLSFAETGVEHLVGSAGEWRVADGRLRRSGGQVLDLAARVLK